MSKFKIGDLVECIVDENAPFIFRGRKGKIIEIEGINITAEGKDYRYNSHHRRWVFSHKEIKLIIKKQFKDSPYV